MNGIVLNLIQALLTVGGLVALLQVARRDVSLRALWIVAFATSMVVAGYIFAICQTLTIFGDYRKAYWPAGRAALEGADALRPMLEQGVYGFVNMPLVALFFSPVTVFPEKISAALYSAIALAAFAAAFLIVVKLLALDARRAALALFACAAFGPLIYGIREGNTSHALLLPLIAGIALARERRDLAAGALFGFAAVVKPPLLLLGVYAFMRGRMRIVLGGLVTCAAALALSVVIFGWDLNALWIESMRAYSGAPVTAFNNQSIAAASARMGVDAAALGDWNPLPVSEVKRGAVLALSAALALAGVAAAALHQRKAGRPASNGEVETELVMVLTLLCAVSTLSWSHYHVWMLPGFALAWMELAHRTDAAAGRARLALGAAFILAAPAEFITPMMLEGGWGALSNLLTSHLLIASLILYGVLVWLRWTGPALTAAPIDWRTLVPSLPTLRAVATGGSRA